MGHAKGRSGLPVEQAVGLPVGLSVGLPVGLPVEQAVVIASLRGGRRH
jgi:hypothetical protein